MLGGSYLHEVFGEGGEGRGQCEVMQSAMLLRPVVAQVDKVLNVVMGVEVEKFLRRVCESLPAMVDMVDSPLLFL